MRKITQFHETGKPDPGSLLLAVDVSSRRLDLYSRYRQAAFALTRKDRLLGPYYHRKIAEGMPARKAKVACMRKLLKILYGAAKSNQPFNEQRVYRYAG